MNNLLALFIFVAGLLLLAFALFAGDSVSAGLSKLLTGSHDYVSIFLGAVGLIGLIASTVSLSRPSYS